ncbi:hypothetical protein D3C87_768390 [compost metagenome]
MRARGNFYRGFFPNAPTIMPVGPDEVYYTSTVFSSNTTFQPATAGAVAGDIIFVAGVGNSEVVLPGSTYSDTTSIGGGLSRQTNAYKVLSPGDITTNSLSVTCPSLGNFTILLISGVSTFTRKYSAFRTEATAVVPGFTKSASSKLILAIVTDRTDNGVLLPSPTGFSLLRNGFTQYFSVAHAVRASDTYTSDSNFTVFTQDAGGGTPYSAAIAIYEAT